MKMKIKETVKVVHILKVLVPQVSCLIPEVTVGTCCAAAAAARLPTMLVKQAAAAVAYGAHLFLGHTVGMFWVPVGTGRCLVGMNTHGLCCAAAAAARLLTMLVKQAAATVAYFARSFFRLVFGMFRVPVGNDSCFVGLDTDDAECVATVVFCLWAAAHEGLATMMSERRLLLST